MARITRKYIFGETPIRTNYVKGELHAKSFNEAEIHKRAKADPDAQPLTPQQLAKFKPANTFAKKPK